MQGSIGRMASPRVERLKLESKATFALALPLVAGQLLTVLMNVVDTMLAGRLDTATLAAVAMGYQLWVLVLLVVLGVLLAVPPAVAQLDGAKRHGEIGPLFRQAIWLGLAVGVVLTLTVRHARPLLVLMGLAPDVVPGAIAFLDAISWGAPALALFYCFKNLSDGLSLTRPTMYFSLLALVVLLPLAYVLMYGKLGVPALGAAGAGYAHAATLWVEALVFGLYVATRRHYERVRPFGGFEWPNMKAIAELLRVGVPMGVAIFMEGSLFVAVALLAGTLGAIPAAAHQIAISVASIAFMVPLGLGMATTVRVGNAVGRDDPSGVAWACAAGVALMLVAQLVSALAMALAGLPIASLYSADLSVLPLAVTLLFLAALFQFPDGIQGLFNGALRGLKDTTVPMAITMLAYWGIGFPCSWWLGLVRGGGAPGLWMGLIAGLTVSAALLGLRFFLRARGLLRARRAAVRALADATPEAEAA